MEPPARVPVAGLAYRPATKADLAACASIWRVSINDYTRRLNQPDIPDDLAAIIRLYDHLQATDGDRFIVAETTDGAGGARIVAFTSAVQRGALWFLSMLFVLPEAQGSGVGRALLDRVLPPPGSANLATCTDSVQPISNGLYASLGMAPRMPLLRLVGLADRPDALRPLPDGVVAVPFNDGADGAGDRLGGAALDGELAAIDREVIGFEHPLDHDMVRREGRRGFLYTNSEGRPIGYAYASEAGRVGPIAVREPEFLDAAVAHIILTVRPRGAFGIWLPGAATTLMPSLLRAGFRIEGFPCLVCWDRPLVDFSRYVPISPGLL